MPRNPFQYLLPVAPAAFVGRWPLVNQMARDLTQDGGDSHAIIAGRRCGKSSLLNALAHDLRQGWARPDGADWLALPLHFDFKAAAFPSVEAFFARILSELCRRVDLNTRRRPADAWPTPVRLDAEWFATLAAQPTLTLRDFEDAVGYLLDQLATLQATVRLVLLLDEVDETLDEPWMTALFNQLRALIYSSDLHDQVRLVLAGSRRFLDQVSDRGSPLWNVLKLHYLTSFDRTGFDQFTPRWSELPPPAFDSVWQQSGGHPFLAQYLLHHAWETVAAATIDQVTPALLTQLVQRFSTEQAQDLQGWVNGVEIIGLRVYNILPQPPAWLTEAEIAAHLPDPALEVKRGLTALCYHGLARHDNWTRYQSAGHLFRTWFTRYGEPLLLPASASVASPPAPAVQVTVVTGNDNTVQQTAGHNIAQAGPASAATVTDSSHHP